MRGGSHHSSGSSKTVDDATLPSAHQNHRGGYDDARLEALAEVVGSLKGDMARVLQLLGGGAPADADAVVAVPWASHHGSRRTSTASVVHQANALRAAGLSCTTSVREDVEPIVPPLPPPRRQPTTRRQLRVMAALTIQRVYRGKAARRRGPRRPPAG